MWRKDLYRFRQANQPKLTLIATYAKPSGGEKIFVFHINIFGQTINYAC